MLVNKTVNMTADCRLTEDGENIMTLSGNVNANGTYSYNRYVHDRELYKENKVAMEADADAFEAMLTYQVGETE